MRRDILALCAGVILVSIYVLRQRKHKVERPTEFIIDPAVYSSPPPKKTIKLIEAPRQQVMEDQIMRPPYELVGFGHDSHRNIDEISVDEYLNLPLVGSGLTFDNKYVYEQVDDELATTKTPTRYKYLRLSITDATGDIVHIGGIDFMKGGRGIHGDVVLWNPHTGEKKPYSRGEFSDDDQLVFIFCFSEPIILDSYRIKSSNIGTQHDPKEWILEGSANGNYWTHVDNRSDITFPLLRGVWTTFSVRNS